MMRVKQFPLILREALMAAAYFKGMSQTMSMLLLLFRRFICLRLPKNAQTIAWIVHYTSEIKSVE
jgi:hypothetical protein